MLVNPLHNDIIEHILVVLCMYVSVSVCVYVKGVLRQLLGHCMGQLISDILLATLSNFSAMHSKEAKEALYESSNCLVELNVNIYCNTSSLLLYYALPQAVE